MDALIILVCLGMAYSNFSSVSKVPFSAWGLEHYLVVLVSLGLIASAVVVALRMYKKWKTSSKEGVKPTDNATSLSDKAQDDTSVHEPPEEESDSSSS